MSWVDYLDWIVFLTLLAVGYFAGRAAESRHFASIRKREKELAKVLAFSRLLPGRLQGEDEFLVIGGVVVADDAPP